MNAPHVIAFAVCSTLVAVMPVGAARAAEASDPSDTVTLTPGSSLLNTSDTRANGHVEFVTYGLHVSTDSATDDIDADSNGSGDHYPGWADKAAGYVATDYPLTDVGSPSIEWLYNEPLAPAKPGMQVVVDKDDDGDFDGILVGEPWAYGDDWWSGSAGLADSGLSCPSGCGNTNSGSLDAWRAAYPSARVIAVGFSLGSGAHGNGTLVSMTYGDTRYEFSSIEPLAPPQSVTPVAGSLMTKPNCDRIKIKTFVRKLHADQVASPAKLRFTITDRGHTVSHSRLSPGVASIFRRHIARGSGVHHYQIYVQGQLLDSIKVGNTCA